MLVHCESEITVSHCGGTCNNYIKPHGMKSEGDYAFQHNLKCIKENKNIKKMCRKRSNSLDAFDLVVIFKCHCQLEQK